MSTVRRTVSHSANKRALQLLARYRVRLGVILANLRQDAGLSQEAVADVLGVGATRISSFERGAAGVSSLHLKALAELYGQEPADFGKLVLRYTEPWLYAMIFGTDDAHLLQDLKDVVAAPKNASET